MIKEHSKSHFHLRSQRFSPTFCLTGIASTHPTHPLLKPVPEFHGFKELNEQEARELDEACVRRQSGMGSLESVA